MFSGRHSEKSVTSFFVYRSWEFESSDSSHFCVAINDLVVVFKRLACSTDYTT